MNKSDDDKLLVEALPPEQSKRVAFMIGRLNPPSQGHYKVISKMKEFIRKNPDLNLDAKPVIVIIAGVKSSEDKKKNPLTADERISFLEASGKANGCIFLTAKSGFVALGVIRDNGYEPIAIGAGSDRAEEYKKLLDKSFNKPDNTEIKHFIIPGLDRLDSAIETKKNEKAKALDDTLNSLKTSGNLDDDAISASVARRAVELGYLEEFTKIVGLENKPNLAKTMFNKLRKSFELDQI
jgi:uncharacterized protein YneF (UPF0154 family)